MSNKQFALLAALVLTVGVGGGAWTVFVTYTRARETDDLVRRLSGQYTGGRP